MTYRDDLEAALARIHALESELEARADGPDDPLSAIEVDRLKAERDRLREEVHLSAKRLDDLGPLPAFLNAQIRGLQKELLEAKEKAQQELLEAKEGAETMKADRNRLVDKVLDLERRLAELRPAPNEGRLPSVFDRNRSFDRMTGGQPAGVACARCRAEGFEVEMRRDSGLELLPPGGNCISVVCPRCADFALARLG
jgi:hypothetical protein